MSEEIERCPNGPPTWTQSDSRSLSKRQSSAEIVIQRLKNKFMNKWDKNRRGSSPDCSPVHNAAGVNKVVHDKNKRSRSLAVFRSKSIAVVQEQEKDRVELDATICTPRQNRYGYQRGARQCYSYSYDYKHPLKEKEASVDIDDEEAMEIQRQIYQAKSEAKTVSLLDGCLYIDYQYVGPLPPGCVV